MFRVWMACPATTVWQDNEIQNGLQFVSTKLLWFFLWSTVRSGWCVSNWERLDTFDRAVKMLHKRLRCRQFHSHSIRPAYWLNQLSTQSDRSHWQSVDRINLCGKYHFQIFKFSYFPKTSKLQNRFILLVFLAVGHTHFSSFCWLTEHQVGGVCCSTAGWSSWVNWIWAINLDTHTHWIRRTKNGTVGRLASRRVRWRQFENFFSESQQFEKKV